MSRLTHTLTRMGQLVYLPRDQKYRIGPSAVAMSTSMMRGLQLRHLIRMRLQEVAEQLPGTVGFVIPDRFHLVYLEVGRAANAIGLSSTSGTPYRDREHRRGPRLCGRAGAGSAEALLADMEREIPESAKLLRPRLDADRYALRERGYVTVCGCGARISTDWPSRCGRRNIRPMSWSRSACFPMFMMRCGCTRTLRREFWN